MKKADLIEVVADKAEMSRAAAARAVHAIFDTTTGAIADAVRAGEHIAIPGFGKFSTRTRGARKGRNPQTGQEIDIPERTVVHFTPGKGLAEASRGGSGGARKSAAKKGAARSAGAKAATTKAAAKKSTPSKKAGTARGR